MMNSIKQNFVYNALYQLLTIIIPIVTTPYLSRVLGANGIGVYSYSYSIAQYYTIFILLGLNNYGNRSIAKVKNDRGLLAKTFWSIYFMQLSLGVVMLSVYSFYTFFLSKNSVVSMIMGIYVISVCCDINWFFFGMEKFRSVTIRNMVVKIITTILVFLLVKTRHDVYKYCLILVLGMLCSQIALWPYAIKVCGFYRPTWEEVKIHIRPNCVLFLTVLAVSLFKIMDKIMLGIMTNTEQVGFYESAEKIISIPTALVVALGTVMLPRTTYLRNEEKDTGSLMYKSILFAMFISTSMSFGIMAVSQTFVPLFYGPGYEVCVPLYLILLPSCLFFAFGNVIRTQYLLPNEMDKVYVQSGFLGAGINLAINAVLIPEIGAVGAAVGTLIAEMSVCIYQAFRIRKEISIRKFVVNNLPFVIAGTCMFFCVFCTEFRIESVFLRLMAQILSGVLIYMVCLFIQLLVICKVKHRKIN